MPFNLKNLFPDEALGTISLNTPNTDRGHCAKTLAIIRHAANMDDIDWLVIADDDTLIRYLFLLITSHS